MLIGVLFGNGILQQEACLACPTWRGKVTKHVETKVRDSAGALPTGERLRIEYRRSTVHRTLRWICGRQVRRSLSPRLDALLAHIFALQGRCKTVVCEMRCAVIMSLLL